MTKRRNGRLSSILTARELRMLAVSAAVGVIAGLFITNFRLHLGLPGHKAIFWMTPVIVSRLLGRCKAGTTAGALSAAFTSIALGGHLAGGVLGLPLVGFAGIMLDVVINSLEKRQAPCCLSIPVIGLAGMSANVLCLVKRLLGPAGGFRHFIFGARSLWFDLVCYAFFGLAAGLIAAGLACLVSRRRQMCRGTE